jgi:pyrimidine-nucleoside phosphorylase
MAQTHFLPAELIKKKRSGGAHTKDELQFIIDSFVSGTLPEYQMSAWLMAVFFRGMTPDETAHLTETMLHSGRTLDFSHLPGVAVDKHSTGGVGDKTSMILAPIAAAAGARVPMIAGRGLGHTGGTLDKLESIPGFNISLSLEQFSAQIEKIGVSIIGQTKDICPADKKIYALRDVTATIESLPLICASIMSKKLAEGIGALVLDVKHGSGAFMKTVADAEQLADKLMEIGAAYGKRVAAVLSNMDQPLGRFIGNSLEMGECFAILKNESYLSRPPSDFADTTELSLELAGQMIWLSGVSPSREDGVNRAREVLQSGKAWEKFEQICQAQGGDLKGLPVAKTRVDVLAQSDGFVGALQTEAIGIAALSLGAGRSQASDKIDPTAGIEIHHKLGEAVQKGKPLFTLYANFPETDAKFAIAKAQLLRASTISLQKPAVAALITKRKAN